MSADGGAPEERRSWQLGRGRWVKTAAWGLILYATFDAFGGDMLHRFMKQWWLLPPVLALFGLARYLSSGRRRFARLFELVPLLMATTFMALGVTGQYRFRTFEVTVDVRPFAKAGVPEGQGIFCSPESVCLILHHQLPTLTCYSEWTDVPLPDRTEIKVRVPYKFFEARDYDMQAVKMGGEWHDVTEMFPCHTGAIAISIMDDLFPFWRL